MKIQLAISFLFLCLLLRAQVATVEEDFESTPIGGIPTGWTTSFDDNLDQIGVEDRNGNNVMRATTAMGNGTTPTTVSIATPEVSELFNKVLSFRYVNDHNTSMQFKVYAGELATPGSTDVLIRDITLTPQFVSQVGLWDSLRIDLSSVSGIGGKKFIRFEFVENIIQTQSIAIDDVKLDERNYFFENFQSFGANTAPIGWTVSTFYTAEVVRIGQDGNGNKYIFGRFEDFISPTNGNTNIFTPKFPTLADKVLTFNYLSPSTSVNLRLRVLASTLPDRTAPNVVLFDRTITDPANKSKGFEYKINLDTVTNIGDKKYIWFQFFENGTASPSMRVYDVEVKAITNDPPIVANAIADQQYQVGFDSTIIDLTDVFVDPDENVLTYTAESSNPAVVELSLTGDSLTIFEGTTAGNAEVYLTADDGNGETVTDTFSVVVNTPPTDWNISSTTVEENLPVGSLVGRMTTTDADPNDSHIYLRSGTDANAFSISGDSLLTAELLDFEDKNIYNFSIITDDQNGGSFEKGISIQVVDVNERPVLLSSIEDITEDEDFSDFQMVLRDKFEDPDQESLTYQATTLQVGNGDFVNYSISNDTLSFASKPDQSGSFSLEVTATDAGGLSISDTLTVTVNPVNDPPSFSTSGDVFLEINFTETETVNISPDTVPADESSQTVTYSLSPATVSFANVSIDSNTGTVSISAVQDGTGSQQFSITADDGQQVNNLSTENFTLIVANENQPPTDILLSASDLPENSDFGTVIGQLTTDDPDTAEAHRYILSGADADFFTIDGNDLVSDFIFNYEEKSSFEVEITSIDRGQDSVRKSFMISVLDQNDAPSSLLLSKTQVVEGVAQIVVGQLTTEDEDIDDTHTYEVSGQGSSDFLIDNQGQLVTAVALDRNTRNTYQITIESTDSEGASIEETFTITVIENTNSAPTDISLDNTSIMENSPIGSLIGRLSTADADPGDTHTYSLSGADEGEFLIEGDSLVSNTSFDFEDRSNFSISISSNDGFGGEVTENFTILILDEDDVLSIDEEAVVAYPNPVDDFLFIKLPDSDESVLTITDLQGKELIKKESKSKITTIDLQQLKKGIYLLNIERKSFSKTFKIQRK